MDKKEQIRQRLKEMASEVGPAVSLLAQVSAIDLDERTCDLVDDEGLEFPGVRLRPVVDDTESLTLIPKLNTWVLAIRIEDDAEWMIVAAGELDAYRLVCDDVQFNGGANGGLVKWVPEEERGLKEELDRVKDLLTHLLNVINGAPIPEPGSGANSALQIALQAAIALDELPDFELLEDEKVKH